MERGKATGHESIERDEKEDGAMRRKEMGMRLRMRMMMTMSLM